MKSLAILIEFHKMKDDLGLMVLAPEAATRVCEELGWVEGVDFKTPPTIPQKRDYLFVGS